MKQILVTGSTDGLGLAAARRLIEQGHSVVVHARSQVRAADIQELTVDAAGCVVGDLSSAAETRALAEQANAFGRFDAIIHNAGVMSLPDRAPTPEDQATVMAVNVLAPYMLTCRIMPPGRLIYLASSLQQGGYDTLDDIEWQQRRWNTSQAYSESKLYVTAMALAMARRWPDVVSHAVDPGWIATKMGGPNAPGDLVSGQRTQVWLATSDDAEVVQSGGYWRNQHRREPPASANDPDFQDRLLERLARLTGDTL